MGVKELIKKIRKEREDLKNKIKRLEDEIKIKESDPSKFIVNTRWERFQLKNLHKKLEELS